MTQDQYEGEIGAILEKHVPQEDLGKLITALSDLTHHMKDKVKAASPNRTVLEFHKFFNADIDKPITVERIKHRLNLMFEELSEFADAGGTEVKKHYLDLLGNQHQKVFNSLEKYYTDNEVELHDPKEMLDALCDLQYVLSGTNVTFGIHNIFDEAFGIVHENNMRKLHVGKEAVMATEVWLEDITLNFDRNLFRYQARDFAAGGKILYLVTYNDKVMKPRNHVKVSLDQLVGQWEAIVNDINTGAKTPQLK